MLFQFRQAIFQPCDPLTLSFHPLVDFLLPASHPVRPPAPRLQQCPMAVKPGTLRFEILINAREAMGDLTTETRLEPVKLALGTFS